ncbi:MAG: hypothetical protein RIG77_00575 [Cyclobacteriaceae bacterium]
MVGDQANKHALAADEHLGNPVYSSSDFGGSWTPASPGLPSKAQVSYMKRFGNEIMVGTDNHGLFISKNNVTNWIQIGASLPAKKITALYQSHGTIFVGLFEHGIFSNDDLGLNWNPLNYNLPNLRVRAIIELNDDLFVGIDDGIFKLDRQQKSWSNCFGSVQVNSFHEFEGNIVAATNKGVLLSSQGGERWNWIHKKGAVHNIAVIDGKITFLYISGEVYMCNEWSSWYELNYAPKKLSYPYEMIGVDNRLLMSNNYGIHRSSDGGKTWQHIFKTEEMAFMDFVVIDHVIYGGTKTWGEYRRKSK